MGFPRLRMISFRVSDPELTDLKRKARRAGLSLSEFVRKEVAQADRLLGIVDISAYGIPSRTVASGGAGELVDGSFAFRPAA